MESSLDNSPCYKSEVELVAPTTEVGLLHQRKKRREVRRFGRKTEKFGAL